MIVVALNCPPIVSFKETTNSLTTNITALTNQINYELSIREQTVVHPLLKIGGTTITFYSLIERISSGMTEKTD